MRPSTPEWFYPDELDIEAGMTTVSAYADDDQRGREGLLTLEIEDGAQGIKSQLSYEQVSDLHRFFSDWLIWAEGQGYGG